MSEKEDDATDKAGAALLSLPETAVGSDIWKFWAQRAEKVQEVNIAELALERAGDSSRHLMILPEDDPKEKQKRDDRKRREQIEQQQRELRERQDRLLAQIEGQQFAVEQCRREIEDNALRLRDGRRVYVDGNRFRDEEGRVLSGADEAEASLQHEHKPRASTWKQKQENVRQDDQLRTLKEKILNDRAEGVGVDEAASRLTGYEKEFAEKAAQSTAQAPVNYGSADYTADYDVPSSVPAFTQAAADVAAQPKRQETEMTETKMTPRPVGPSTFKPG
jgi:hypothetical protein